MKKKIISYLLYAITALPLGGVGGGLLSSCSLKEDADFGETASQRSEAHLKAIEELLPSAPNGWLVEYYGDLNFGGYNMMMKFEGDQVTIASEKFGPNHMAGIDSEGHVITTTSHFTHYKMEQSMGSILSFDEFNETFHYFSMPDNPDYSYDKADGLYGDFEFRVMQASQDTIILRGKKHNNRIVMTPIPANKTWESIITEAAETEDYMMSSSYTLEGEGRTDDIKITVKSNGGYRCLVFTYKDTENMKQTVAAPYIVNDKGYTFYSPVEVNGMVLDGVDKGDTQDYYLFRNNPQLQLDSYMPTLAEQIQNNTWYLYYPSLGAYAQPKWDAMMDKLKTAGKNKTKITIYTATIGKSGESNVAASLTTSADAPYFGMQVESKNTEGDEIRISSNATVRNKAGKTYWDKYKWDGALNTMFGHTFKLECDNQRRPTYIKMTDVNEPTNVITVYANAMYFMNDQSYYND